MPFSRVVATGLGLEVSETVDDCAGSGVDGSDGADADTAEGEGDPLSSKLRDVELQYSSVPAWLVAECNRLLAL